MKRSIALALWLVIAWLALWRDVNFANVFTGVMFATILVVAFPVGRGIASGTAAIGPRSGWRTAGFTVRPLPTLKFLGYFAWKLLEANAVVAWQVVRPATTIAEGIVAVELHTRSDGIATMVADAVTLTPGTMTIDIERRGTGVITLFIHVLQLGDPDDIRDDTWVFESMALAAFGDTGELTNPVTVPAAPTGTTSSGDARGPQVGDTE